MKKLPIGLQTFSRLIKENYVYIDKTQLIYQLITEGSYYFLSRPRRFGKSLLVSTLEALFSGNRTLFQGLAIDSLPYQWEKHPIIMISFAGISCTTPEVLTASLKRYVFSLSQDFGISLDETLPPSEMLHRLIKKLSEQNSVVLLIDEYDYSILKHIHQPAIADQIKAILRDFYTVIKDLDRYLRFVFLTGVSQFTKTSIFSGLNNLNDISLSEKYNALVGYTEEEIITYLDDHITPTAQKMNYTQDKLLEEIATWYDGYLFCYDKNATKLYNPFSVLLFLDKRHFANYWFETGTPTFLINLIKANDYPVEYFESTSASAKELKQFDINHINLKTVLFQTGYLTIKDYDPETQNYMLQSPNKEVTQSLAEYIFISLTNMSDTI